MNRVIDEFHLAANRMSGDVEDKKIRPKTTLFMLISVDGKISTGCTDNRDFDTDLLRFEETKNGLSQYYDIEKTTDEWTMCTGKIKAKLGINNPQDGTKKIDAKIVLIDNEHLTSIGIINLVQQYKEVVLFTKNSKHPAFNVHDDRLTVHYMTEISYLRILNILRVEHECNAITIQTGSMTNAGFINEHLIDFIDFVIAPIIVGGDNTPSVVGDAGKVFIGDLSDMALLELEKCEALGDSYIHLRYKVKNSQ